MELTCSTHIAVPPAAVWLLLTDDRGRWWPEMAFEAVAGAGVRETWQEADGEHAATGEVVEVDAGRLLAFDWIEPGWAHALRVRFTLAESGRDTLLTVSESGFEHLAGGEELRAEHAEEWDFHLGQLTTAAQG